MALLLAALAVAVGERLDDQPGLYRLAAVGLLLGLATLVRPVSLPVFPALLVAWLIARRGWRVAGIQAAAVGGAAALVLLPWVDRNAVVMGQPALSTNTGDNLCMSRRVGGSGGFEFPNERCFTGPFDGLQRPEFELARDTYGRRLAFDFVRAHPGEELALIARRAGHTFKDDTDGLFAAESYGDDRFIPPDLRMALSLAANGFALPAAIIGTAGLGVLGFRTRRRDAVGGASLLVALTAAGLLVPPLVFFGDPRFHVPAAPFAAIGVGVAVHAVWTRHRQDPTDPALRSAPSGLTDPRSP
ncbi:MAG: hypothetical protein ACR2H3_15955 [Acidimicrobiales bacterium]